MPRTWELQINNLSNSGAFRQYLSRPETASDNTSPGLKRLSDNTSLGLKQPSDNTSPGLKRPSGNTSPGLKQPSREIVSRHMFRLLI